jgi:hypothetical protein
MRLWRMRAAFDELATEDRVNWDDGFTVTQLANFTPYVHRQVGKLVQRLFNEEASLFQTLLVGSSDLCKVIET